MTYVTSQGDQWDYIAFKTLGSCDYVESLINSNRDYVDTFIFSAGVELNVPDIEEETKAKTNLPPWKRNKSKE